MASNQPRKLAREGFGLSYECGSGKIGHSSENSARKAAKRLGHFAYHCPICKLWHTSNHPAKKERKVVRRRRWAA